MKKIILALVATMAIAGCTTAERDVAVGAGVGAVAGQVIGGNTASTLIGAGQVRWLVTSSPATARAIACIATAARAAASSTAARTATDRGTRFTERGASAPRFRFEKFGHTRAPTARNAANSAKLGLSFGNVGWWS